eukprot:NODE_387_length_1811_cov_690.249716_g325_i0.p6 GENE.NODE_387_length_1811_cov_690.249716_g325_i0~~NODE_387_length_1811_cov_690.249716_g325_i0.p6  ORF type:complete len:57 (-),score=3.57 NODE_387_length_1811_cov_690.249716_g325_i0:143-313(-)
MSRFPNSLLLVGPAHPGVSLYLVFLANGLGLAFSLLQASLCIAYPSEPAPIANKDS